MAQHHIVNNKSPVGLFSRNPSEIVSPCEDKHLNLPLKVPLEKEDNTKPLILSDLQYSVEDCPPWYMCVLLGFQHYLTMFGSTVAIPLILAPALCMGEDNVGKSEIISTMFFVSGIVTLLQTTFGCRLPIIQGGSAAFLAPSFAILSAMEKCPRFDSANCSSFDVTAGSPCASGLSITPDNTSVVTGSIEHREVWQARLREIQGAIMVASMFQVVIGFSGIIGMLMRFIGPLAITPTITLVGLSLFKPATDFCAGQWYIALTSIAVIVVFSQYLRNTEIPCGRNRRYPIFKLFPVILAVLVVWGICAVFTAANVLPKGIGMWGHKARTDARISVLNDAAWIRFPYPGQWGTPTVSVSGAFGMLAGVLASMMESIGDYYACARLAGATPPPLHAINRGIGVEGIGCVLAGAWGSGNGTTSYSENIGAIGITKVGSRRVIQVGAIIMILLAIIGKFGAVFVTIPDPVVGGVFFIMFSMVTSVGLSNLQFVNLNSSRNLFILGFSIFVGIALPQWISNPQNDGAIKTGNTVVDQIIKVLLSTSMFVGGFIGFVLDNTVPGTAKERGLTQWRNLLGERQEHRTKLEVYDLPFGMSLLRRPKFLRYVPFSPTFEGFCSNSDSSDVAQLESEENAGRSTECRSTFVDADEADVNTPFTTQV